jgi:septal ring factor EnvC (AmiA/AmiB activator)
LLALALAFPLAGGLAGAQEPALRPSVGDAPGTADALKQRDQELQAAREAQKRATEAEARLRAEIAALGEDRRKLNEQLIEGAARLRGVETRIGETEARLAPLAATEQSIRRSLEGRRAVIAEVLAALQRIGRAPPPVLVVRAEDALESVRSAMLLGAVLPEMRTETEALAGELADLVRIRKEIAGEREQLATHLAALTDERRRVELLVEERQRQQTESEKALEAERQRALEAARQVDNLRDLIAKLEQGLDSATRAARAAARAEEARQSGEARTALAALKDPGRMAPAVSFASARGLLPLPVNGIRIRSFGAPDTTGGTERGLSVATRAGAQVTAPCDAWVVYAGPFRSYGQLLILNAGGGYHVLLAGMERISVNPGQFVLTGEPVAVMGGGSQVAAILASGTSQPVLYIEFRKDGTPVDPSPWWAASESEKVRG